MGVTPSFLKDVVFFTGSYVRALPEDALRYALGHALPIRQLALLA
jgi:hypothetical protein